MADLIDIRIPEEQEEGTTLELASWLKKVGDVVDQDEAVAEVATDKAVLEIPSPVAGVLRQVLVEDDQELEPGQVIARVEAGVGIVDAEGPAGSLESPPAAPSNVPIAATATSSRRDRPLPHPAVARFAALHGVSIDDVEGTGERGRVTHADLAAVVQATPARAKASRAAPEAGPRLPPVEGPSRRVRHDPMRRTIARNMTESVLTAPHVTAVFDCDLSAVMADRQARKDEMAAKGIKLTFTAYFVRAVVEAIRAVPEVNSRWHDDALEVFEVMHIGVGTALEDRGLVVPVVRNVQDLELQEVAAALTELTETARAGKLSPADMQGSTFTISNHGVQGTLVASPIIIRQPESAILGIGKIEDRAVVIDGEVRVRPMMYVSLTIDHRALDAYHTNRFLQTFCRVIEQWGQR